MRFGLAVVKLLLSKAFCGIARKYLVLHDLVPYIIKQLVTVPSAANIQY